jgi:hypothetical protein
VPTVWRLVDKPLRRSRVTGVLSESDQVMVYVWPATTDDGHAVSWMAKVEAANSTVEAMALNSMLTDGGRAVGLGELKSRLFYSRWCGSLKGSGRLRC